MKKVIIRCLLFAVCKGGGRTYVNHMEGLHSIADDILVRQDTIAINRMDYQKIQDSVIQPKAYKVKQWGQPGPDAPLIRVDGKRAFWNNIIYLLVP